MSEPGGKDALGKDALGKGRIAAYGLGDFGFNLFYTGLNLYLLYYYTDVLNIAPATAGLIFMLPVIWDAVTDPIMGAIASRTRTRWGSYRPYILLGAPIMCASFVLMFAAPVWFPNAIVLACLLSHMAFRTAYTIVSIPYTALSAAMTRNGDTRSKIAGARMVFAISGGLLTAFSTLKLAESFGDGDLAQGFVSVALLFAAIALALMILVFATSRERILPENARRIALADTLLFLRRNTAFWILFASIFAGSLGSSIGSKAIVYYGTYFTDDPDQVPLLLTGSLLITGISVPLWAWAAHHYSKRDLWFGAALCTAAIQATLLAIAPTSIPLLLGILCLNGFFAAAFVTMFWAILPDTVEFGEWRSGVRDEGVVFGLNQLALKAASGFGVGLLGLALGAIGYVANTDQSAATLEGLRYLTFGVPLAGALLSAILIRQMPLTRSKHQALVRYLARNR